VELVHKNVPRHENLDGVGNPSFRPISARDGTFSGIDKQASVAQPNAKDDKFSQVPCRPISIHIIKKISKLDANRSSRLDLS
jgi:hypothetical protein